jgi:hypothetical protein
LELNDAGDIISDAGLSETVNALIGAFTSAMAEMDPEQGEVKPKRRRAS